VVAVDVVVVKEAGKRERGLIGPTYPQIGQIDIHPRVVYEILRGSASGSNMISGNTLSRQRELWSTEPKDKDLDQPF
jgi:hypothetical protein